MFYCRMIWINLHAGPMCGIFKDNHSIRKRGFSGRYARQVVWFSHERYLSPQNITLNRFLKKHKSQARKYMDTYSNCQAVRLWRPLYHISTLSTPSLPTPTLEKLSDMQKCYTVWIMKTFHSQTKMFSSRLYGCLRNCTWRLLGNIYCIHQQP